ncbi:MAG: PEGA domain-containing protein [Candidatus Daviesbacteria bacterium]|nr:PEGA domain-containing protein [Candidatus Daviesbacteria bacterium]
MVSKRFLVTVATVIIIGIVAIAAIFLSKGYVFSTSEKRLLGTGIITVTSTPDGASVYIDGHLTTATNATLSQLSPKTYEIKLVKEGFITWEKKIEVKEGLVSEVKATLFPALPTIYPLTFNGAINPILSPDSQKLAFAVPMVSDARTRQKGGIWVWTMNSQPLSLNRSAEPHQIVVSSTELDFSKASFKWSPDSKQLLITLQQNGASGDANSRNFLVNFDAQTSLGDLKDITPLVANTVKTWEEDKAVKDTARLALISNLKIRQIASDSASLIWSPDESKIITGGIKQQVTPTKLAITQAPVALLKGYKVYDLLTNKDYDLPEAKAYFWLPDSRHVILVLEDKISICEYDGSNTSVIFAGKFTNSDVFPWSDSSRLVVLTSFNTPTASIPNLFGINLK